MSANNDRPNIVNPNPEAYTSVLPTPVGGPQRVSGWENMPEGYGISQGERRGTGYDYENKRNRWVMDLFHVGRLTNVGYMAIGDDFSFGLSAELRTEYGINNSNKYVTLQDALAYAALYPHNAKVIRSKSKAGNPRNPRLNGRAFSLELVGGEEAQQVLDAISARLASNAAAQTGLNTVTTAAAQQPSNQSSAASGGGALKNPLPKAKHVVKGGETLTRIAQRYNTTTQALLGANPIRQPTDDDPGFTNPVVAGQTVVLTHSEASSQLPEISPIMGDQRTRNILKTIDKTGTNPQANVEKVVTKTNNSIAEAEKVKDPAIDLTDWKNNVDASSGTREIVHPLASYLASFANDGIDQPIIKNWKSEKIYYNSRDKHWYAVARVPARHPSAYDTGLNDLIVERNITTYRNFSLASILEKAEKYSGPNLNTLSIQVNQMAVSSYFLSHYGTPNRPQPVPPFSDTWMLAIKVPTKLIDALPAGTSDKDKFPSTRARARNLFQAYVNHRIPFSLKVLKKNLKNTKKTLLKYNEELRNEGINPSMMEGINLEEEAEKLEPIPSILEEWAESKNITIDQNNDKFEILTSELFVPITVFLNGAEFGALDYRDVQAAKKLLGLSGTTYALIYYSDQISKLRKIRKSQRPSPIEFVQKYIFPSPVIKPSDLQNKIDNNKITGNYPQEAGGKGVGSNSFSKQKIVEKKDASFKTKQEVNKEFEKRLQFGSDMLGGYVSVLNSAGCDTPLAKYLNDAFMLYQLIGGRSTFKQLVGTVIKLIKDDIIVNKKTELLLLRGAGYVDDPEQIDRDIENYINREIQCAFELLGDVLEKEVLSPGGVPPELTSAIKNGIKPPSGVRLGKTPTADFMKLWRDQLFGLILNFVKQLIMEAFKEILLAAAGCGGQQTNNPQQSAGKPSPQNRAPSPYGNVRINDLVDDNGTIDLVNMAAELNIQNTYYVDGSLIKEPATLVQLRQLNDDSSDVMVDMDVAAVLQGTGPSSLIDILNRTYNFGRLEINAIPQSLRDKITSDPPQVSTVVASAIISQYQESLSPGDTRYASLNLTKENIIKYFKRLGQLLGPDVVLEITEPLDPKTAYCDSRDILSYGIGAEVDTGLLEGASGSTVLAGGLSRDQLLNQIKQQIDADVGRILSLCELNADAFNFIFEIQNFWDALPFSNFFRDFLDAIRKASQEAQGIQAKSVVSAMTARYREPEYEFVRPQETEIYKYFEWYFQDQTFAGNMDEGGLRCRIEPDSDLLSLRNPHFVVGKHDFITDRGLIGDGEVMLFWIPDTYAPQDMGLAHGKAQVLFRTKDPVKMLPGSTPGAIEILAEFDLESEQNRSYSIPRHVRNSFRAGSGRRRTDGFTSRHVEAINQFLKKSVSLSFGGISGDDDPGGDTWTNYQKADNFSANVNNNITVGNTGETRITKNDVQLSIPYANNLNNIKRLMGPNLYGNTHYYDQNGNREYTGFEEDGTPTQNPEYNPRSGEPRLQVRVKETIQRAAQPVFETNGDPCNITKEEEAANATLSAIQQRLFNFVLNIAPIFNSGYSLATPDTFEMISSYLFLKIKKDLERKQMIGIIYKGLDFVAATCSSDEIIGGRNYVFNPAAVSDPEDRLEYVVKTMLKQMFLNLSTTGIDPDRSNRFFGWSYLTKNYWDDVANDTAVPTAEGGEPNTLGTRTRYRFLAEWLYSGRFGGASYRRPMQPYGLNSTGLISIDEDLEHELRDADRFAYRAFLGYFPIPLLTGIQVIYLDKVVDLSNNFPQVAYYANKRVTEADNSARILIQETDIPASSAPFYEQIRRVAYNLEEDRRQEQRDAQRARELQGDEDDRPGVGDDDQGEQLGERLGDAGMLAGGGVGGGQQGGGGEQGEGRDPQNRERNEPPPQFPVTINGIQYRNIEQLRSVSTDLAELKRKIDEIKAINARAQGFLNAAGAALHAAENEYLNNRGWPTNKYTTGNDYRNFSDPNGRPKIAALRWRLYQTINDRSWRAGQARALNTVSGLGISSYGGVTGPAAPGRAGRRATDLQITDQYFINSADFSTTRAIFRSLGQNRDSDRVNLVLGAALFEYFKHLRSGTTASWAGLRDGMESTNFYRNICETLKQLAGDKNGWLSNNANYKAANSSGGVPQGNWDYDYVKNQNSFLGCLAARVKVLDIIIEEQLMMNTVSKYGSNFETMSRAKYNQLVELLTEINNAIQERS